MPRLGLVTVLFKSDNVLEGFFKSLSVQTFTAYHLFLIDNSSNTTTDVLIAELADRYSIHDYSLISNDQNLGVAKGNNQGIELAIAQHCTHTLLLNNDIEFEQDFLLEQIYNHSVHNSEAIIVPKILYYDTRKIWMAGAKFRKWRGTVHHVGIDQQDGPSFNELLHFEYSPTCFMLINNDVFRSIGLMDEKYFVYYDDTDFMYRAYQSGFRILYLPSLTVLHKVSNSTGGGESLFTIYYTTRNRVYYLRKNFSGLGLLVPMVYTLLTRVFKFVSYQRAERLQMLKAIKDGFAMEIDTSNKLV